MEAYTGFAEVYDLFMDNVPYEAWGRYLISLLQEQGVSRGSVLELGCGTGKMTRFLSRAGYDMIGVDCSQEMLRIAYEKECGRDGNGIGGGAPDGTPKILYVCQDMREFELFGTVKAAVCVCDSLNYLLEEEDLLKVFRLANTYLDPGGVFIFDMNTLYKYREILGERTICENREEASFIWENYYNEETQVNQYDLTLFVREREMPYLYRKYEETHFQRGYALDRVQRLIEEAGMEFVAMYDAFTKNPVRDESDRAYIIAKERGKQDKL